MSSQPDRMLDGARLQRVRPLTIRSRAEVSGYLVGSAAFKAVGKGEPLPAGSIPVHLRQIEPWSVCAVTCDDVRPGFDVPHPVAEPARPRHPQGAPRGPAAHASAVSRLDFQRPTPSSGGGWLRASRSSECALAGIVGCTTSVEEPVNKQTACLLNFDYVYK
jgi:hypothetical protein